MIQYNSLLECSVSSWNNISRYSISTNSCQGQFGTGFQSVHIFSAKWTCSVIRTGGLSCRKCLTILAVYWFVSKAVVKGVLGPWRRVNPLLSPRWVRATEQMVVLYAVMYIYMESDPKPKESGTATSTATLREMAVGVRYEVDAAGISTYTYILEC